MNAIRVGEMKRVYMTLRQASRPKSSPSEALAGRNYAALATLCDVTVVVFGGSQGQHDMLNGTWLFCGVTEVWART